MLTIFTECLTKMNDVLLKGFFVRHEAILSVKYLSQMSSDSEAESDVTLENLVSRLNLDSEEDLSDRETTSNNNSAFIWEVTIVPNVVKNLNANAFCIRRHKLQAK